MLTLKALQKHVVIILTLKEQKQPLTPCGSLDQVWKPLFYILNYLHKQAYLVSNCHTGPTQPFFFLRHHVPVVDVWISLEYLRYCVWKTECMYCSQRGPCRQPWVRSDSGETGCSSRETCSQAPCTLLTSTGGGVVRWDYAWFHNSSDDELRMSSKWYPRGWDLGTLGRKSHPHTVFPLESQGQWMFLRHRESAVQKQSMCTESCLPFRS